ncbi:DUF6941 family protein [Bradyrhizobium xenonodulans]|uniref:DUF6941 family protein n=1 Tax=Bradyrhizobium xenonodulans TaxID=2736875 RepID=UPI003F90752F
MRGLRAFAFFCEDVRRENGGRETLIGILPDTVQVPRFPWVVRRITIHFRIRIQADFDCDRAVMIDVESENADIEAVKREPAPMELVRRTVERARNRGLPYGTLIGRVEMNEPLEFPQPAKLTVVLKCGDEKEECGLLNIVERTTPGPSDQSSGQPHPSAPAS